MPITSRFAAAAARAYGLFRTVAGGAAAAVDPFFNYVTALLHGDGTNGAQNNTFLDSSTNNFTITRNGNTTQGTFSPFSQTGWSNYFDGSGDYLSVASATALNLSTGDFTIECWVYPITGINDVDAIISKRSSSTFNGGEWRIAYRSASTAFGIACGSNNVDRLTPAIALNQWNHVAFVRSSGTLSCYANGVRGDNLTWTDSLDNPELLRIGLNVATYDFPGYISNVRIVKGTAVYSGATYTVPTTPLTAITNTSLLTCQSNRFLDASSNNFTVTVTGDVSVQAFSPFNPTSAWSASSNGGSGYFDGSGDYLSIAYNSAFNFGTGDFTIECWVYPVGNQALYTGIATQNGSTNGWYLSFGNSNAVRFTDYATAYLTSSSSVNPNSWTHVAVTRSGTAMKMFFNGVVVASTTSSATFGEAFPVVVGFNAANYFLGYITDLRLVKGTAVYTAAFTPPTAPLTAITNTSLLLNYTNAGIYDNAAVGNYETVGNAQVSTSVKKYGTGSMAFDGTGDWLSSPNQQGFNLGSGDFTIECWVYANNLSNLYGIFGKRVDTGVETKWVCSYINTTGTIQTQLSTSGSAWLFNTATTTAITSGTWNHIAWVRLGSNFYVYVNGLRNTITTTLSGSVYTDSSALILGATGTTGAYILSMNGYIDDFRITKGIARYLYNFTPPTAAFPNIGGALTADPYFNYTTLLLPGNGTNGAQNNTFLDSSSNAFTITRNGNTTQGNFSPFSQTGWGNYFGGSSDYINFASSSALSFASDFTVEAWVYNNYSTGTFNPAVLYDSSSSAISSFEINNGTNYPSVAGITATNTVTRYTFSTGPSVPVLQWVHVAWVRSSGTVKVYVNGTASTSTLANSAATGQIVQVANGRTSGAPWNGYISNLRITSSAVYTSNFTPSSVPLTAISGTQLLTCQANRFVDASSNALSPTLVGSPSVQAFSPFAPTAAWSASTNGGSGYFDGSGDYLNGPATGQFAPTGDFTISMWIYPTSFAASYYVLAGSWNAGAANEWLIQYDNTGAIRFLTTTSSAFSAAGVIKLNQWQFISVSRSGTTLTGYVNGTSFQTYTLTGTVGSATKVVYIGAQQGTTWPYVGWMSDFRLVDGSAQSATPPTAPATAISGTNMLLSCTNGAIVDATAKNDLETVGNAQISTTQSKFGGSSMYFDGTGDRLTIPFTNDFLELGIGGQNFTVEAWIYPTNTMASVGQILSKGGGTASWSTTNGAQYQWGVSSSALSWQFNSSGAAITVNSGTLTLNAWQHVAVSYDGITTRTFLNGVLQATSTSSYTAPTTRNVQYIGMTQSGGFTQEFYGYIDDFRITKGIARYTSNFTPPTSAFLLQ